MSLELTKFIEVDTSNQEIASKSVIKIVSLLSNEFKDNFNEKEAAIKLLLLTTEIIKEVEILSNINKNLTSNDKKKIAIYLGYLTLKELYKSNTDLFKSYIEIYEKNIEPWIEMLITVSKVVNVTNPELSNKIKSKCCICL